MTTRAPGDRFAAGWAVGALLALLEIIRAGMPASREAWVLALATVGLYPLLAGLVALGVSAVPWIRSPVRLHGTLAVLVLFPWFVLLLFPHLTWAALARPEQWPRLVALLVGSALAGGAMGRHHCLVTRLALRGTPATAVGMAFLLAGGCMMVLWPRTEIEIPPATGSGPNVLLITLDTVRRDALGCYGGPEGATPTIDSLAASGLRVDRATSCAPWTLASVSSILTGLHPSTTGVFTGENRLAEGVNTLAEAFASAGYHTHAVVTNTWLRAEFGVAQGFSVFNHRAPVEPSPQLWAFTLFRALRRVAPRQPAVPRESADDVVDQTLRVLQSEPPTPFFLWLHFNDAHDPYAPPHAYLPRDLSYHGQFRTTSGRIVRLRQGNRIPWQGRRRIKDLYQGEIAYLDACLGRLFAGVRQYGLQESTIVALLADHGEEFWEHGSVGHGHTLHGELLSVPLIITFPGRIPAHAVHEGPCTLADVCPTLLGYAGLPRGEVQGISLMDSMPDAARPTVAEALEFFWEQKTVSVGQWKLIHEPVSGRNRLFDIASDPMERYDLSQQHPATVAEVSRVLAESLSRFRDDADRLSLQRHATTMVLSPKLREQLRAQGYLE